MLLLFAPGSPALQKLRVSAKAFKVFRGHQPGVCVPLQKGQYGGMLELLRRQPPDLVSQVCSSASLSASYLCPELFSGEMGQRGAQGPGMSILGTFKDDHSVTLPTVGSGPALPSSYRPRKARSENLSDSVRGSSTSTSVAEGQRCLFVASVLQLEAEPHSHRCSSWGDIYISSLKVSFRTFHLCTVIYLFFYLNENTIKLAGGSVCGV